MEKLAIIDGHNLLFRMFYGIPSSIKNRNGQEIRGVIGFIGGLKKLVESHGFDRLIVVFDTETSITNKLKEDSDYKQNRIDYSKVPDEENPFTQLNHIYKVLSHLGITYIEANNHEADDYIASLCHLYKDQFQSIIVSTDQDFLQLVNANITVYNPQNKINFTPEKVYEKYQVHPHQIVDYKILVGDKSDNIKGIPSIGPKTAIKILKCGTINEILLKEKVIEDKLYHKLSTNKHLIDKYRLLIQMNLKLDITIALENLIISEHLSKKTRDILIECDLH